MKLENNLELEVKNLEQSLVEKEDVGGLMEYLVRQTIKVSGIDGIALTKLDVLDELDEIKMCIAYELDGKKIDYLPAAVDDQLKVKPIYKTFKGWKSSTNGIKKFEDLPQNAKSLYPRIGKIYTNKNIKHLHKSRKK